MTTTHTVRVSPQSKMIVLKKKAPKSPTLGVPSSTRKQRNQINSRKERKKQNKTTIKDNEFKSTKPSKQEPSLSRNDSFDNERLPPSTSTIKKGEGFQWESTQYTVSSTTIQKPSLPSRTLKSLNFKSSNDNISEDDEELKEYYKLLNEKW
ncbi:predicted protein [Naegleria gruberi]|uniref:Predicted protein n=1 Tax=Naegleria gruberi TaxID=5762 RepID=D2VU01_NAEGR|nr:uncharacterized protein NAEGRDRAFT_52241 [Naegleria gruberi]EFC39810.1 predicted protein [Naegleria gruberi]|eukprot:XP_002672554.1 predicted protein [Naegleria gruberi strain NEG-M]